MPNQHQRAHAAEYRSLYATALDLVGGDRAAASRVLELVANTNRAGLVSLRESIDKCEWEQVASAAHRIAGSARVLGCTGLLVLLTRLEAAARARERGRIAGIFPLVSHSIDALNTSIEAALSLCAL
ncbi:Hpt domain-containing protein [Paraburkholderia sp. PREW-6R]|uniref:Hpt domain-containing protein n=1 Tax=Paraburkholderia sp. PREW-6R TaxID=3141544 RepID=UPI0031F4F28C